MAHRLPQPAPFQMGARLQRVNRQGSKAGTKVNGETVYFDRNGAIGVIVKVCDDHYQYTDDFGQKHNSHGWSTLQFDEDTSGIFQRAIDINDVDNWKIL